MTIHLSGNTAKLLYGKLRVAPTEYFQSFVGRNVQAKALWLIREKDGRQAAREFLNVLAVLRSA